MVLLGAYRDKYPGSPVVMDSEGAVEHSPLVPALGRYPGRYVVRAIRHRRDESASRLPAIIVGYLCPDALGHCNIRGNAGVVLLPVPALHSRNAYDLNLRNAHAVAGVEGGGGGS